MARASLVAILVVHAFFWQQPVCGLRAESNGVARSVATPVAQVITLLEKLSAQIGEEGKREAAQYDKYACFCKEQASQKTYQIKKSEAQIETLNAEIDLLNGQIADLSSSIAELGKDISALEVEIEDETKARAEAREKYVEAEKTMSEAITAVDAAIGALKASKGELTKTKLAALPQLQAAMAPILAALPAKPSSMRTATAVADRHIALLKSIAGQGQPEYAYAYHSNEVIDLLRNLLVDFKQSKEDLDKSEFEAKSISETTMLGLTNEKGFKQKEKDQKSAILSEKTTTLHEKTDEKDAETAAMDADTAFRAELSSACEAGAQQWDQRSQTRASELTALSEAVEVLKTGVAPAYSANKKLVGLAAKSTDLKIVNATKPRKPEHPGHAVNVSAAHGGNATRNRTVRSLLQLPEQKAGVMRHLLQHLSDTADRLHSTMLLTVVVKASAQAQEDHFGKVRELIKDLVARLEQEALDEVDSKSFCDEQMAVALDNRDTYQLEIEGETANIAKEEAEKAKLLKDIAVLSQEIAGLNKALNEATELRAKEKADNEKTLTDAGAGKTAVEEAVSTLKDFYNTALLQKKHRKDKQPAVDRDGKAMSDYAPKLSYGGDYHGSQDASKGIFGLLEVIVADFERTVSTVTEEESAAQAAFEEFEAATKKSIDSKDAEKADKEGLVTEAEVAIVSAKDKKRTAETLHSTALKELEKLKPMCVGGEESWGQRKEKREQEITALKDALKILEDWKS